MMPLLQRIREWLYEAQAAERWYSASLSVDPEWLDQVAARPPEGYSPQQACDLAVHQELDRMGFQAKTAYQDPTSARVWSAIVKRQGDVAPSSRMTISDLTPVSPVQDSPPSTDELLDRGLTQEEASAVRVAISRERDPKRLEGFAEALAEDHPIAHALVLDKARRAKDARTFRVAGRALSDDGRVVHAPGAYLRQMPLSAADVPAYRKALALLAEGGGNASLGDLGPSHIAEAAYASFAEDGRTLAPSAVNHFSSASPGYTPPPNAARQLAFATLRPKTSGVREPSRIRQRMNSVRSAAAAGDTEAKKAAEQIRRAQRFIERQNWVMWYNRASEAGIL